jgi:hypothetical protein
MDAVNFELQELAVEANHVLVDMLYESMLDENLCRMVSEYTMDDVGCEFDPKF